MKEIFEALWQKTHDPNVLAEAAGQSPPIILGVADFLYRKGLREDAAAQYERMARLIARKTAGAQEQTRLARMAISRLLRCGKVAEAESFVRDWAEKSDVDKLAVRKELVDMLCYQREYDAAIT